MYECAEEKWSKPIFLFFGRMIWYYDYDDHHHDRSFIYVEFSGKKGLCKKHVPLRFAFLRYPEQDYSSVSIIVILIIKKTVRSIDGSLRRVAVVVVMQKIKADLFRIKRFVPTPEPDFPNKT